MLLFPRSLLTKECLWDPFQDMMFMPWDSVSVISSTGVWGTGHIHTKWEEMDLTWKGTLTISSLVYCIIHLQYTIISMTWTVNYAPVFCLLFWPLPYSHVCVLTGPFDNPIDRGHSLVLPCKKWFLLDSIPLNSGSKYKKSLRKKFCIQFISRSHMGWIMEKFPAHIKSSVPFICTNSHSNWT